MLYPGSILMIIAAVATAAAAAKTLSSCSSSTTCCPSTSHTAFAVRLHRCTTTNVIINSIISRRLRHDCTLEESEGHRASNSISTTTQPQVGNTFFEQQLEICHQIIRDHDDASKDHDDIRIIQHDSINRQYNIQRARFKEHPRCTARFGEVILHARDSATTCDDCEQYQNAIHNARAVVKYIHACLAIRNDDDNNDATTLPIRRDLIADIVSALTSPSLRKFRTRQIVEDIGIKDAGDVSQTTTGDFTLEQADLEILGRLYYSAIRWNEQYMREIGLTFDHGGFTVLLALCRAASDDCSEVLSTLASAPSTNVLSSTSASILAEDGAKLDAALSNHFNGIVSPGCRFSFSRRHGLTRSSAECGIRARSKHLIVAFSSLGNGLVRHEFGGSLAQLNKRLLADCGGSEDDNDVFDVLFVADPGQSWYQKDSHGKFDGFGEYEKRIRVASQPYHRVSLVGDSMGGSGALLFSHLATDESAVVIFSPQIDLVDDEHHVSRYDMSTSIRNRFCNRLLQSVEEAILVRKTNIFIHRGLDIADIRHTDRIIRHFSISMMPTGGPDEKVEVVEHEDCGHHQIALHLKEKGQLSNVLHCNLIVGKNCA